MKNNKNKKKKISKSEEKNIDYKDAWLRMRADYENLKKEMEAKRKEWVDFANLGLLVDLLPVIENFNQGLKYIPEDQEKADWIIGIKHIKKQLDEFMNQHGLKKIVTIGKKFDPNLHEAVSRKKEDNTETDVITDEVVGGYTLNGKVVQVAKVIVAE